METHPAAKAPWFPYLRSAIPRGELVRWCLRSARSAPLSILLVLAVSTIAHARTETLHWAQNNASQVAGYRVHYGFSSGNYTTVIEVPSPPANPDNTYTYDIQVPDDAEIFVALKAYNSENLESAYSNEQRRAPPLGRPGQPTLILTSP